MKLSQKQIIVIGAAVLLVLGFGSLFFFGGMKKKPPEVKLAVWGTDSKEVFERLTQAYKALRPNVAVNYVQLPASNYSQRVLEGLAAGAGPDIFMVENRSLLKDVSKLAPVPPETFPLLKLRELFPAVVEEDFASGGYVYALPLSIDTLALFYNRDLLDRAAITAPPATWQEFLEDSQKLRLVNERGEVVRAGAALGGSLKTVAQAPDILQLLMLQNGVQFTGASGAAFAARGGGGLNAMSFYLQFADTGSAAYMWSEAMSPSREAFAAGKAALMLDYYSVIASIRAQSPYLRFGVAAAPQLREGGEGAVAFARYKGLAVSRQSAAANWAWDFIVNAATDSAVAAGYSVAAGAPPALRSEIARLVGDPEFDVFARQALIARSWSAGDGARADAAFDEAIQSVLTGQADAETALERAGEKVTQILQGR